MGLGKVLSGAGIGGVAGLALGGLPGAIIGAGLGGLSSYTTEAQNKANQKALDRSNQYDYWLWQNSNEYNSPIQQMQRLAQAGLNPNLVYGSGSVTGNTSGVAGSNGVASLTAQDYAKNSLANYQSMLTAKQMEENIQNTKENTMLAMRQGANTNLQGLVLKHNLNYARSHNLPVGSVPGMDQLGASYLSEGINWLRGLIGSKNA